MHAVCSINIVLIDYKMTTVQAPKITPYVENDHCYFGAMWEPFLEQTYLRACLHHYMEAGGPQVDEVTRFGGVTRLSIQSLILL